MEVTIHYVDSKEQTGREVGLFVAIVQPVRLLGSQRTHDGVLSGMRVAAFVSGGLIPEELRGTYAREKLGRAALCDTAERRMTATENGGQHTI